MNIFKISATAKKGLFSLSFVDWQIRLGTKAKLLKCKDTEQDDKFCKCFFFKARCYIRSTCSIFPETSLKSGLGKHFGIAGKNICPNDK